MTSKAPDTGKPLVVSSAFNLAGQLTSQYWARPEEGATSIGYAYDRAGQRTSQTAFGPDGTSVSNYTYTGAGRLASVSQENTTTRFGYDGLGRNLTTDTSTEWGSEETTQVWDGLAVVQQSSDVAGTATLLRDALGQVAMQSTAPGDLTNAAAWSLHDRLGSSIATTTTNGRVTDLADYSDFGVPIFDSTGWAGSTSFTGELGDATSGLNSYFSRTYDPFAGTWLTADSYRGSLAEPGSQNRYGYVQGNPSTYIDAYGFRLSDPGAYAPKVVSSTSTPRTADGWDRYLTAHPNVTVQSPSKSSKLPDVHEEQWWNPGTWGANTRGTVGAISGILAGIGATLAVVAIGLSVAACVASVVCGIALGVGAAIVGGIVATTVTHNVSTGGKDPAGLGPAIVRDLPLIAVGAALPVLGIGIRSAATGVINAGRIAVPATTTAVIVGGTTSTVAPLFPKRPLPRDANGLPVVDEGALGSPHTQLGTQNGRNGGYPQAREFDADGNPVRDIDFTDHGRPSSHDNPHQHSYLPNPTGGTPQRGPAQPMQ